jgi:hypothetical protein
MPSLLAFDILECFLLIFSSLLCSLVLPSSSHAATHMGFMALSLAAHTLRLTIFLHHHRIQLSNCNLLR